MKTGRQYVKQYVKRVRRAARKAVHNLYATRDLNAFEVFLVAKQAQMQTERQAKRVLDRWRP